MAIGAATAWRVRPGGDDANGAAYDATISGAGTDYTQQDAAQLSLTDLVCQASDDASRLKLRSATGGFTSAMIGNAIRILSTGTFTAGYYFIVGYDSTNLVTLDRSPAGGADRTGGSGKAGGAAATIDRIFNSANGSGDKIVAGNTIYVRGAGSSFPASADYTITGYIIGVSGDTTNGRVKIIGENGRPRLDCNGLRFHQTNYVIYSGVYFRATGTSNLAQYGFINGHNKFAFNCVFDLNDKNGCCIGGATENEGYSSLYFFNEFFSKASAPTANASARAILCPGYSTYIMWNHIHHMGDAGIYVNNQAIISQNIIHHCKSHGITVTSARADMTTLIANNTIDANEAHGIDVGSGYAYGLAIVNNILSNHTQASKYGLNFAGTLANNDRMIKLCDYNAFYNNTGHRNGISAGASDQTDVDPGYLAANDYRIGAALKALGFPTGDFLEAASGARTFLDIGALQRMERSARAAFQLGM